MSKFKRMLQALILLSFVPWAQAATVDLTEFEWNLDVGLYAGPVVLAGDLAGSTLLFDSQTPAATGFELEGIIEWVLNDVPATTSNIFGVYDGIEEIAFLINTTGGVWTLFEGTVDPIGGNYMVGTLSGLFQEEFNGYWTATKGVARSGGVTPIALPTSMLLFISALGIGFVMTRRV